MLWGSAIKPLHPESCFAYRKRLASKADECDALRKDVERQAALLSSLTHDRDRAAAALAAANERLRRTADEGGGGAARVPGGWAVDAGKVSASRPGAVPGAWACTRACF